MQEGLVKAIEAIGSARALAEALNVTPQAISQWEKVPHLRVIEIERITGVPRQTLRPDLYPPAPAQTTELRA